ncbi:hypothetical protein [Bradyrhizobium cenepequi]
MRLFRSTVLLDVSSSYNKGTAILEMSGKACQKGRGFVIIDQQKRPVQSSMVPEASCDAADLNPASKADALANSSATFNAGSPICQGFPDKTAGLASS